MRIAGVAAGSPAARAGLRPGDELLELDGSPVRDSLDFHFRASEESVTLRIRRASGEQTEATLTRTSDEELGIILPPDPVRCCGNHCVFCFIDQNPKGLRPSLYVKDEDYRLSLLYGNYVTMTHLRDWEVDRILEQRLSPLYVSVHVTEPEARRRLLGCHAGAEILPLLRRLGEGGIHIHTQIVVVPEYNDGELLHRTLDDLERLHPGVASVAIVPVGLTRHRHGLPPLRRVSEGEARKLVGEVSARQQACLQRLGTRLHFLADEFYLLAGAALPPAGSYEEFSQLENGVGLVRSFEAELRAQQALLPDASEGRPARQTMDAARRQRALVATGELFAPLLRPRLDAALERTGEASFWRTEVVAVPNHLFGTEVTVAGLLSGGDIVSALRAQPPGRLALLPPEIFNNEGCTLDEMTAQKIADALRTPVQVGFDREQRFIPRQAGGKAR